MTVYFDGKHPITPSSGIDGGMRALPDNMLAAASSSSTSNIPEVFAPTEHPFDALRLQLQRKGFLTEDGDITAALVKKKVPNLNADVVARINGFIDKVRVLSFKDFQEKEVQIKYTLRELFGHIFINGVISNDGVEVVGGTVFWLLGEGYYKEIFKTLGLGRSDASLVRDFMATIKKKPSDNDIRFYANNICHADMRSLGTCMINFFVRKLESNDAYRHFPRKYHLILKNAFHKVYHCINPHYSTLSPRDDAKTEIAFVDSLPRQHLFTQDALRVDIDNFLTFKNEEAKPISDLENQWTPLLHRMLMIIDADDIGTIDDMGFPMYLSYLTRGRVCLKKEIEDDLVKCFVGKFPKTGVAAWFKRLVKKVYKNHHNHEIFEQRAASSSSSSRGKSLLLEETGSMALYCFHALQVLYPHLDDLQRSEIRQAISDLLPEEKANTFYSALSRLLKNEKVESKHLLAILQIFTFNFYLLKQTSVQRFSHKVFLRRVCGSPALQLYLQNGSEFNTLLVPLNPFDAMRTVNEAMASWDSEGFDEVLNLYHLINPADAVRVKGKNQAWPFKGVEWDVDALMNDAIKTLLSSDTTLWRWQLEVIKVLDPYATGNANRDSIIESFPHLIQAVKGKREIALQLLSLVYEWMRSTNFQNETNKVYQRISEVLKSPEFDHRNFITLWALMLAYSSDEKWHRQAVSLMDEHQIECIDPLVDVLALSNPALAKAVKTRHLEKLIQDEHLEKLQAEMNKGRSSVASEATIIKGQLVLLTNELKIRGSVTQRQLATFIQIMESDLSELTREQIEECVNAMISRLIDSTSAVNQQSWNLMQLRTLLVMPSIVEYIENPATIALEALKSVRETNLEKITAPLIAFVEMYIEHFMSPNVMRANPSSVAEFWDHSLQVLEEILPVESLPEKVEETLKSCQENLCRFLLDQQNVSLLHRTLRLLSVRKFLNFTSSIEEDLLRYVADRVNTRTSCGKDWSVYVNMLRILIDQSCSESVLQNPSIIPSIECILDRYFQMGNLSFVDYWIARYVEVLTSNETVKLSTQIHEWVEQLLTSCEVASPRAGRYSNSLLVNLVNIMQRGEVVDPALWHRAFSLIAEGSSREAKNAAWIAMTEYIYAKAVFLNAPQLESATYLNAIRCLRDINLECCSEILLDRDSKVGKRLENLVSVDAYDELFYILASSLLYAGNETWLSDVIRVREEIGCSRIENRPWIDKFDVEFIRTFVKCRKPGIFTDVCTTLHNLCMNSVRTVSNEILAKLYEGVMEEFFYYFKSADERNKYIHDLVSGLTRWCVTNYSTHLNFAPLIRSISKSIGDEIPLSVIAFFGCLSFNEDVCKEKFKQNDVIKAVFELVQTMIANNHPHDTLSTLTMISIQSLIPRERFSHLWAKLLICYIDEIETSNDRDQALVLDRAFSTVYRNIYGTSVEMRCVQQYFRAMIRFTDQFNLGDALRNVTNTFFSVLHETVMRDASEHDRMSKAKATISSMEKRYTVRNSSFRRNRGGSQVEYPEISKFLNGEYLCLFLKELVLYQDQASRANETMLSFAYTIILSLIEHHPEHVAKIENLQIISSYFNLTAPFEEETSLITHLSRCKQITSRIENYHTVKGNPDLLIEMVTYINPESLLVLKKHREYQFRLKSIFSKLNRIGTRSSLLLAMRVLKVHSSVLYEKDPKYVCNLFVNFARKFQECPFVGYQDGFIFDHLIKAFIPDGNFLSIKQKRQVRSEVYQTFQTILDALASVNPDHDELANPQNHKKMMICWVNAIMKGHMNHAFRDSNFLKQNLEALKNSMKSYLIKSGDFKYIKDTVTLLAMTFQNPRGNNTECWEGSREAFIEFLNACINIAAEFNSYHSAICVTHLVPIMASFALGPPKK